MQIMAVKCILHCYYDEIHMGRLILETKGLLISYQIIKTITRLQGLHWAQLCLSFYRSPCYTYKNPPGRRTLWQTSEMLHFYQENKTGREPAPYEERENMELPEESETGAMNLITAKMAHILSQSVPMTGKKYFVKS